MTYRRTFEALVLTAFLTATGSAAQAETEQYPDWRGEWTTVFPRVPGQQLRFDPSKPYGKGQEAPLTEEYKKIYEDNLAEVAAGKGSVFSSGNAGPSSGIKIKLTALAASRLMTLILLSSIKSSGLAALMAASMMGRTRSRYDASSFAFKSISNQAPIVRESRGSTARPTCSSSSNVLVAVSRSS
jgi:hypothetical protein